VPTPYQIASVGGTYSFDQATGAFTSDGGSFGDPVPYNAPAVSGSTLVLTKAAANLGGAISLVQYGTRTGVINFWSNFSDARPATTPMMRGNQVFVASDTAVLAFPTDSCTPSPIPSYCLASWTTPVGSVAGMPVSLSATQLAVPLANGNVAVLDAATGTLQWTAVTGSHSAQSPALDATSLYIGTADGKVHAFPIAGCGTATCSPTSTSSAAGAAISSQPVVAGGVVYVGTTNSKLVAFDTAGRLAVFDDGGCNRVAGVPGRGQRLGVRHDQHRHRRRVPLALTRALRDAFLRVAVCG
jgi:hypothetical protein